MEMFKPNLICMILIPVTPFNLQRLLLAGLLPLCLTGLIQAQSVFQANLHILGGNAQLQLGCLYFRATGPQVDFVAVLFPFGALTGDLNPVLNIPDASVSFSLGTGTHEWLSGTRTVADQNPFLPAPPWLPHSYDENGNPLYVDSPVIREADLYHGSFHLPEGFLEELLAGRGSIKFNSALGGDLSVAAVPEPATGALLLLGGGSYCFWRRRQRPMPPATPANASTDGSGTVLMKSNCSDCSAGTRAA